MFSTKVIRSFKPFKSNSIKKMSTSIQTEISSSPIVLFQSSGCPYCAQAISALKATGREFKVIEASSSQRNELKGLTGVTSVPSVWVKGKFVGGCNDGPESWMGIKKLIANNKLDDLLA
jgi:glutaredoxin 3